MIREERLYKVKETHFPLRIFGIIFVSLLLIGALHTQIVVLLIYTMTGLINICR